MAQYTLSQILDAYFKKYHRSPKVSYNESQLKQIQDSLLLLYRNNQQEDFDKILNAALNGYGIDKAQGIEFLKGNEDYLYTVVGFEFANSIKDKTVGYYVDNASKAVGDTIGNMFGNLFSPLLKKILIPLAVISVVVVGGYFTYRHLSKAKK